MYEDRTGPIPYVIVEVPKKVKEITITPSQLEINNSNDIPLENNGIDLLCSKVTKISNKEKIEKAEKTGKTTKTKKAASSLSSSDTQKKKVSRKPKSNNVIEIEVLV
jgi:hypothetical protein